MPLTEDVSTEMDATGLLPRNSRVLVAVSGGIDSMVLLHVLHQLAPARGWTLVVAHLNHRLRGRSSDADERFVRAQCARLKLPCVTERRAVRPPAQPQKPSLEMAARSVRHLFLAQTARRRRCPVVALAHHADDQAELVLLRLLRGAGSEGLGGMRRRAPSPADARVQLIRPLLGVSRQAIEAHAAAHRIPHREDRSNVDRRILRNRIRHELLPLLRSEYQPATNDVLVRTAGLLRAEADCIRELASHWLAHGRDAFTALPLAVQRRVLHLQALELGVTLDFDATERLLHAADTVISVAGGRRVQRKEDGRLRLVEAAARGHSARRRSVVLGKRGRVRFGGREFCWRIEPVSRGGRPTGQGKQSESFDAAAVGTRLVLRHWRAGDRFQPIGMPSAVKLQDLFTNAKVPAIERRRRVVAQTEAGEIVWVEGLRIGERFKLGSRSQNRLIWRWIC